MTTRAEYVAALLRILMRAESEVGVSEASRRNDGARVEEYIALGTKAAREPGLSWCAAFVLWCHRAEGVDLPGNDWAMRRVSTLYEEARQRDAILRPEEPPAPGDLAIYLGRASTHAGPSGHVQIVVSFPLQGRVVVVGGNEGNAVRRSSVPLSAPTCYVRPERMFS
jgi:uncharacterized protein (TIGR02594 family)